MTRKQINKWHSKMALTAALTIAVGMLGCVEEDDGRPDINPITARHALTRFDGCTAFEAYAKQTAIDRMRVEIERERRSMYDSLDNRGWANKGRADVGEDVSTSQDSGSGADLAAPTGNSDGDEAASGGANAETNVQEAGVDEADFVKTDGEHIYVVSRNQLRIVSVLEDGQLEQTGSLSVEGRPEEMFLYGDQAVIFSTMGENDVPEAIRLKGTPADGSYGGGMMEPDMDMDMEEPCMDGGYCGGGGYTEVAVIDVTDPAAPTLVRSVYYAGNYVSSRRINGAVRVVISSPINVLNVPTWVDWWQATEDETSSAAKRQANLKFNERINSNNDLINSVALEDIMPKKIDSMGDNEAEYISSCEDIYGPATPAGLGLLSVVSINLEDATLGQSSLSVMGQEGIVYASTTSLYLTTSNEYVGNAWRSGIWDAETSGIHKFDISSDPAQVTYQATGTAVGRMLNQFCLGEYNSFLRIATTTGNAWGDPWASEDQNTLDNHLIIFDSALQKVSQLDGIGVDEEIYAARFVGDRGFMVTFLQTDPLFTFDLSDPHNPKLVGEWLGPGYSTYLHPFGDNHLIAMGEENWMPTLTLYDVSNFTDPDSDPEMVERLSLGDGWQSAAVREHKAFRLIEEQDLLILPFSAPGSGMNSSGLLLYNVDAETGFDETGRLNMQGGIDNQEYEAPASRSIILNNVLYGLSGCRITSAALDTPATVLDSLRLYEQGESCEYYGY